MRLQSARRTLIAILIPLFTIPVFTTPSTVSAQDVEVEAEDVSDHSQMVGSFAVGYLGWRDIAHGTFDERVSAPVIGVRYWFSELLGLDAGLGFGFESGEVTIDSGGTTTTTDVSGPKVIVIHGGVPLSLASTNHFSFQIVPEMNIGFSWQKVVGGSSDGSSNLELSGLHFDIGARIGGEIHFGFIGVPQLSLQGSIGAFFMYETVEANDRGTDVVRSESRSIFTSTVYDNPWNIFLANVAAFYYF